MINRRYLLLWVMIFAAIPLWVYGGNPHSVVYEGSKGPGVGKRIVYIASDHEYRGEETLPALARIMAKHYGFTCTVIWGTDPADGTIQPGSSHISGLEVLKGADLMVNFLRFANFKDEQMQHFIDYVDRGGPIMGFRTSTHAFKIPKSSKFAKYSYAYKGDDYKGGFGRQVLGETWVGHYGRNHKQSSILVLAKDQISHPIFRGVEKVHTQCGGYKAFPIEGSVTLARGRILNGMTRDAEPDTSKEEMPVVWVRNVKSKSGKTGRVFTTTHGASEDILNDGFRRMLVNAHLWCLGMEKSIKADGKIDFVGPYNPTTFGSGGYRKGVRPADLAGWDTPIMSKSAPTEKIKKGK